MEEIERSTSINNLTKQKEKNLGTRTQTSMAGKSQRLFQLVNR